MKKLILILTAIYAANVAQAQVTNGLVAKYSFNSGNANDEVGIANGTIMGGTSLTSDRFGNINKAYALDGVDSYINLGSSSVLKPGVGSVSLWYNEDTSAMAGSGFNYCPIYLAKSDSATSSYFEGLGIYSVMNDYRVVTVTTESQTTNQVYIFSANPLSLDNWHHAVATYDDDSLWFYIDGNLEDVVYKGFSSTFDDTSDVTVGWSADIANNRYFDGKVDDIRIYNKVLNELEVDSLFNEPNPIFAGIEEGNYFNLIKIYPNPTTSFIQISAAIEFNTNYNIVDISGRVVSNGSIQGNNSMLNIEHLTNGVYFLQIGKEDPTNIKFIKN